MLRRCRPAHAPRRRREIRRRCTNLGTAFDVRVGDERDPRIGAHVARKPRQHTLEVVSVGVAARGVLTSGDNLLTEGLVARAEQEPDSEAAAHDAPEPCIVSACREKHQVGVISDDGCLRFECSVALELDPRQAGGGREFGARNVDGHCLLIGILLLAVATVVEQLDESRRVLRPLSIEASLVLRKPSSSTRSLKMSAVTPPRQARFTNVTA